MNNIIVAEKSLNFLLGSLADARANVAHTRSVTDLEKTLGSGFSKVDTIVILSDILGEINDQRLLTVLSDLNEILFKSQNVSIKNLHFFVKPEMLDEFNETMFFVTRGVRDYMIHIHTETEGNSNIYNIITGNTLDTTDKETTNKHIVVLKQIVTESMLSDTDSEYGGMTADSADKQKLTEASKILTKLAPGEEVLHTTSMAQILEYKAAMESMKLVTTNSKSFSNTVKIDSELLRSEMDMDIPSMYTRDTSVSKKNSGGILVVGEARSGKTTLCCRLVEELILEQAKSIHVYCMTDMIPKGLQRYCIVSTDEATPMEYGLSVDKIERDVVVYHGKDYNTVEYAYLHNVSTESTEETVTVVLLKDFDQLRYELVDGLDIKDIIVPVPATMGNVEQTTDALVGLQTGTDLLSGVNLHMCFMDIYKHTKPLVDSELVDEFLRMENSVLRKDLGNELSIILPSIPIVSKEPSPLFKQFVISLIGGVS